VALSCKSGALAWRGEWQWRNVAASFPALWRLHWVARRIAGRHHCERYAARTARGPVGRRRALADWSYRAEQTGAESVQRIIAVALSVAYLC